MEMQQNKDTLAVGNKLVELCKSGDNMKAIDSLYSADIESQEAMSMPGMPDKVRGIDAIKKKNKEWDDNMEVHSMEVEGPFPLGDRFAVVYKFDATSKRDNKRMKAEEVAVYTVSKGKIVREEFFYKM